MPGCGPDVTCHQTVKVTPKIAVVTQFDSDSYRLCCSLVVVFCGLAIGYLSCVTCLFCWTADHHGPGMSNVASKLGQIGPKCDKYVTF